MDTLLKVVKQLQLLCHLLETKQIAKVVIFNLYYIFPWTYRYCKTCSFRN